MTFRSRIALALLLALPATAGLAAVPERLSGDVRIVRPERLAPPGAFGETRVARLFPRRLARHERLAPGDTLHLGPDANLSWRLSDGRQALVRGPATARINGDLSPQIVSGLVWCGRGPMPQISLAWEPAVPVPGTIARLVASGSAEVISARTGSGQLLHPDSPTAAGWRRSALIALARTDWRREFRQRVEITTRDGVWQYVAVLPVRAQAGTALDRDGIFGRQDSLAAFSAGWQAAPPFAWRGTVLFSGERTNWQPGSARTAAASFPPWSQSTSGGFRLPPDKMALLGDKAGIQRENAIHWQATAFDTPERFWRGNFIIPAWQRYSSPFSEERSIVGLGSGVHLGIDIAAPFAVAVAAPNAGIVRFAGMTTLCGNNLIIDHGRQVFTKIMHMASIAVASGQRIERGQFLGMVGTTGLSTGPHIHWEMLVAGVRVDPEAWTALGLDGLPERR